MKRKTIIALTSLLVSATLFSACTSANKVTFHAYFRDDVDIRPTVFSETLTYSVTLEDASDYNGYSVAYQNGTYTTTLTRDANDVYTLVSNLTIDVTYSFDGQSTDPLEDSVQSTVVFQSTKNALRPVSSQKHIVCHSPANTTPANVNDCYKKYDRTITTEYAENSESGKTTMIDNLKTANNESANEFEIDDEKRTYIDNEQILFALRCMSPSSSAEVQAYAPFSKNVQRITTTFATSASAKDFENIEIDGETKTREISYYPVTIEIKAKNSGAAQTAWIAKTTAAKSNTYRNVMLRYEAPLPYNLGTLTYQLVKADFANKQ